MPELLAVYGTLMSGQVYAGPPAVEALMRPVGPCGIQGRLYSEGDYPWLVAEDEGEVAGELFEVLDAATFDILDAYGGEGRHTVGGTGTYARRRVRLLEPDFEV